MKSAKSLVENEIDHPLRVFLCYSSHDKDVVQQLYFRLQNSGLSPWLDKEDLLAGQDWELEIPNAVRNSDVVIVCLSQNSVTTEGYVQKEIRHALNVAEEKPENVIFIIPVKLEECKVPSRLANKHWVDLFEESGYDKLIKSLRSIARRPHTSEKRDKTYISPTNSALPLSTSTLQTNIVDVSNSTLNDSLSTKTDKVDVSAKNHHTQGLQNWHNHPIVIGTGFIAAIITLFVFFTGYQNLSSLLSTNQSITPNEELPTANINPTAATTSTSSNVEPPTEVPHSTTTADADIDINPTNTTTSFVPTVTPSLLPATPKPEAIIVATGLRLRTGPSTNYDIVHVYEAGTQLKVIGRSIDDKWLKVETPRNEVGWMSITGIEIDFDLDSREILAAPPTPTLQPYPPTNTPVVASSRPQKLQLDGTWIGQTSVGKTIRITVVNDQVIEVSVSEQSDCSGMTYPTDFLEGGIPIVDNSFYFRASYDDQGFGVDNVQGQFESNTSARGSMYIPERPGCRTLDFTWTATKQ